MSHREADNGADPLQSWDAPLVVLGGAIRAWWDEGWDTPEHRRYVAWRDDVARELVARGYLIYRPHTAFKGTWNEKAQAVNDAAIEAADAFLVLSDLDAFRSEGTLAEILHAGRVGTPVVYGFEDYGLHYVLRILELTIGRRPLTSKVEPGRINL
jgi:hypothetical protein